MSRLVTPTLALIIAGGLAGGIALARPSSSAEGADQPPAVAVTDDTSGRAAADGATESDDPSYRTGTRTGNRGGTPPADAAGSPAPADDGSAAADGGSATGGSVAGGSVAIEDFAFTAPQSVAPGAPIQVTNLDGAAHTLTFRSGGVDTGTLTGGESVTVEAPTTPGSYDFFCSIHPSMEGQINVAS